MQKCRLKQEVISYIWNKHGDHPQVMVVPEQIRGQIPGYNDSLGCVQMGNEIKIFGPGVRLIETGGNLFPVDENYYREFYEEIE